MCIVQLQKVRDKVTSVHSVFIVRTATQNLPTPVFQSYTIIHIVIIAQFMSTYWVLICFRVPLALAICKRLLRECISNLMNIRIVYIASVASVVCWCGISRVCVAFCGVDSALYDFVFGITITICGICLIVFPDVFKFVRIIMRTAHRTINAVVFSVVFWLDGILALPANWRFWAHFQIFPLLLISFSVWMGHSIGEAASTSYWPYLLGFIIIIFWHNSYQ